MGHMVTRQKSVQLVSWKQARELGISIHGSEEKMNQTVVLRNAGRLT